MMLPHALARTEYRLLLACLRPTGMRDPQLVAGLAASSDLDPLRVCRWAVQHGAAGFVDRALSECGGDVPEELTHEIARRAAAARMRALFQVSVLAEVAGGLEAYGVRALSIKGPALSVRLHGDPAIRPSNDLDFLVDTDGASEARGVLSRLGFVPAPSNARAFAATRRPVPLEYLRRGVKLELHERMLPHLGPGERTFDSLWRHRVAARAGNLDVATTGMDDTAVHLALHGFRHGFSCLKWLADLGVLLTVRDGPDWTAVRAAARALDREKALVHAYRVSAEALGIALPTDLQSADAARGRPGRSHLQAMARSWFPDGNPSRTARAADRLRFRIPGLGLAEALKEVSSMVFRPSVEDWEVLPFLSPDLPLVFSIVRPLRLAVVAGRSLLGDLWPRRRAAGMRA